MLSVEIFYDGSIGKIEVIQGVMSGQGSLDEIAKKSVRKWKFKPVQYQNKAVSSKIIIPITVDPSKGELYLRSSD